MRNKFFPQGLEGNKQAPQVKGNTVRRNTLVQPFQKSGELFVSKQHMCRLLETKIPIQGMLLRRQLENTYPPKVILILFPATANSYRRLQLKGGEGYRWGKKAKGSISRDWLLRPQGTGEEGWEHPPPRHPLTPNTALIQVLTDITVNSKMTLKYNWWAYMLQKQRRAVKAYNPTKTVS